MPIVIKFKPVATEAESPRPLSKSQEISQESTLTPEKPRLFQSLFPLNKSANVNNPEPDILIDFTIIKEDPTMNTTEKMSPRNINKSREVFYVSVLVDSIKEKLEIISKEKMKEQADIQCVHNKEQLTKVIEDLERERDILQVS